MLLAALVIMPLLGALAAYATVRGQRAWLLAVALLHLGLTGSAWLVPPAPAFDGWLALDALGLLVLSAVSLLFAVVALYVQSRATVGSAGRGFAAWLLTFLAAASLVAVSHHLALLWVGMEGTTLALAPLIFLRRDRRSLEAVWKYLVISSVGIALALLGTFFLATAQGDLAPGARPLVLEDLVAGAGGLHPVWLKAAFIFLLVGYGTKLGLAPMHTWKPDTYGEAPALVAALMAGGLTSCAFLGIARVSEVTAAAGLADFTRPPLVAFGLVSLAVAAAFVIGQSDVKRLLAYSSVEHVGLLVLGLGLGGAGAYGSVLHLVNNALAKGFVFLAVGTILAAGVGRAAGSLRAAPVSGMLLLVGLFAITGSPPFGMFLSEFTIVRAAWAGGHPWIAAVMLTLLALIFVGLAGTILELLFHSPPGQQPRVRESGWVVVGPAVLAAGVLLLGVAIPDPLQDALARAATALGGAAP
ncbi:MAG TPA: proton-conducting transporter membrane subunit [Gemmatimonadales bacterium]|nr:proton-conducting transporter membrane subunit [Gemmatimonadales bacterium]